MKQYFDATVDGWQRIAVVEGDAETAGFNDSERIPENRLPSGFQSWKPYERYRKGQATVVVVSPGGE